MANRYIITPWRTRADLLEVRQQIYRLQPEQSDRRRHAVDRIMAWKLRGNLPHAVESTALLVDAILHHDLTINSTFSVRAAYSAAFSRFVTGFCDIGRQKERTLEPSSMLDIAKQIGMPAEFVALRHEATHEELPGIQRLVTAAEQALTWLWDVYWSRLESSESPESTMAALPQLRAEARQILRAYRRDRRTAIAAGSLPSAAQTVSGAGRSCIALTRNNKIKVDALVDVLIEDNVLAPLKRTLGDSLTGAFLIWDRLLQDISGAQTHFLPTLVNQLLEAVGQCPKTQPQTDPRTEALCSWLTHISENESWDSARDNQAKDRIQKDIVRWCCTNPGYWSRSLGSRLIESGSREFKKDWKELFEASQLGDGYAALDNIGTPEVSNDASKEEPMTDKWEQHSATDSVDGDGPDVGSWVRAAAFVRAPIGVVR